MVKLSYELCFESSLPFSLLWESLFFSVLPPMYLLLCIQTLSTRFPIPISLQNSSTNLSSHFPIFHPIFSEKDRIFCFWSLLNLVLFLFLCFGLNRPPRCSCAAAPVLNASNIWGAEKWTGGGMCEICKGIGEDGLWGFGDGGVQRRYDWKRRWVGRLSSGSRRWKLRWQPQAAQFREVGSEGVAVSKGINSPQPSRAWPPTVAAWFLRHSL